MRLSKKIIIGAVFLASTLLAGNYPSIKTTQDFNYASSSNVAGYFNQIASAIADQLGQNKNFHNIKDTPIAITSIVNIEDLKKSDKFGNSISEILIHEMQVRGYKVIDFKIMKNIRIDKKGDYAFSRSLEELKKEQKINFVLSGTYTQYSDGIAVNCRIVDIKTNIVQSTAQVFVPGGLIGSVNNPISKDSGARVKIVKFIPDVEENTVTLQWNY